MRKKESFIVGSANEAANFIYLPMIAFLWLGIFLICLPYLEELRSVFLWVWADYLQPIHEWLQPMREYISGLFT